MEKCTNPIGHVWREIYPKRGKSVSKCKFCGHKYEAPEKVKKSEKQD